MPYKADGRCQRTCLHCSRACSLQVLVCDTAYFDETGSSYLRSPYYAIDLSIGMPDLSYLQVPKIIDGPCSGSEKVSSPPQKKTSRTLQLDLKSPSQSLGDREAHRTDLLIPAHHVVRSLNPQTAGLVICGRFVAEKCNV